MLSSATPERPVRIGRYDVTGLIRAGGMGTVYDAIDREHGTRVALKTLTELAARLESAAGRTSEAAGHRASARAAYVEWGATAKADRLG